MQKWMMAVVAAAAIAAVAALARAQEPAKPPAKPDSAQVKADIEKAKKDAGAQWADEEHFFCEAPRADRADEPIIEPTKIFDNVYITGRASTIVYAITTSDGILLLDSGYPNDPETVLLAGLKKLGLDPAQVKDIIVLHGHAGHFGGAAYFQEHYGTHVYVSALDWDLMDRPPQGGGTPPAKPGRDRVITEGQPIVLGDLKVMPFAIPGHTPGAVGVIFPVKDNGKMYMAALYGGLILTPGPISDANLQQYLQSIAHFKDEIKKANVEVELENHPLMDGMAARVEKLRSRKPGDPNPFVISQASYQTFMDVMADCIQVEVDRRKE